MVYEEKPDNFNPDMEIVACVVECGGKILLLHRNEDKSQGGKWGNPAGKINIDDESKEHALQREVFEETGLSLEIRDLNFYKTFYVEYPDKKFIYHYYNINLDKQFNVTIEPKEHQAFSWVTPGDALNLPLILEEDSCLKDYYGIN